MKRGFTLLELFIAMSIATVIFAAITGVLSSTWLMVSEASTELDCALLARKMRERLVYDLALPTTWRSNPPVASDSVTNRVGLVRATNIVFSTSSGKLSEVIAYFPTNIVEKGRTIPSVPMYVTISTASNSEDNKRYMLDDNPSAAFNNSGREWRPAEKALQYVYVKAERGQEGKIGHAVYCDRIVIRKDRAEVTKDEIKKCFIYDP